VPPASTNYRFYQACDDHCTVDIGLESGDTTNLTTLVYSFAWTSYRDYFRRVNSDRPDSLSDWVYLEEGKPYYLEARHDEGGGGDHFTVAVEIERAEDAPDHFHQMSEIQYLEFSANGAFERTQVVIEGVDEGTYKLVFLHPTDLEAEMYPTGQISASATADQFKTAVEGWYDQTFGSAITVTLEQFDADGLSPEEVVAEDGTVTKNETAAYKSIYNITLAKYIDGKSVSNIMVLK
jgi:hypothetical protein